MKKIRHTVQALIQDKKGANLVEYLLLLALIAIVVIAAARTFGTAVSSKMDEKRGEVEGL
ncbi:MAG: Flp family type IVb pilin [Polyangiaceae bacterium]